MPADHLSELFFLVDETDSELKSISRAEAHSGSKKIHRSVGIFLVSCSGKMLLQQRSMDKDVDPGRWSYSVSGHVTYGQTYLEAAKRELFEEVGVVANRLKKLGKFLIETESEREFTTFYRYIVPESITLKLDTMEVSKTKWVPIKKITSFASKNPFTSWSSQALRHTGII